MNPLLRAENRLPHRCLGLMEVCHEARQPQLENGPIRNSQLVHQCQVVPAQVSLGMHRHPVPQMGELEATPRALLGARAAGGQRACPAEFEDAH
eukprot:scaffold36031_cov152-Isochrysis_galbana.AAC.3